MLLETRKQIAKYCNRSTTTISTWIRIHGFPASKLPNGNLVTSTDLIDKWILARCEPNNTFRPKKDTGVHPKAGCDNVSRTDGDLHRGSAEQGSD